MIVFFKVDAETQEFSENYFTGMSVETRNSTPHFEK